MFIGEMANLLPYFFLKARAGSTIKPPTDKDGKPFNLMWLWLPALCDMTATR